MPDPSTLEYVAAQYRAAYVAHAPDQAPIAPDVRFTENNVPLPFPDGTWDTVTKEVGDPLTVFDPSTGSIGIFTAIMQNDTPGFLGVRLKVEEGLIVEIEHIVSTRRNLSGPPTPIGEVDDFRHDPDFAAPLSKIERSPRDVLIAQADGYFSTLENNTGELRGGVRFSPEATRFENGKLFPSIERDFRLGRYRFNERVRDREYFLVDEARGVVMGRAFIDHKGVLDDYAYTDGTPARSIFREPQSWGVLEMFKVKAGMITAVEAVFIAVPYFMRSAWP